MMNPNVSFTGHLQLRDKKSSLTVDTNKVSIEVRTPKQAPSHGLGIGEADILDKNSTIVTLKNSNNNEVIKEYLNINKSVDDVEKEISNAYEKAASSAAPAVLDLYA